MTAKPQIKAIIFDLDGTLIDSIVDIAPPYGGATEDLSLGDGLAAHKPVGGVTAHQSYDG